MLNNVVSRYLAKTARITEQKAYITYLPGGSGHTRGDMAYLRVEGNTFPIKDALRAAGLRWLTKYWGLEASTYSPYDRNWQRTLAAMKAAYPKVKAIVDKFNAEVEERNKALGATFEVPQTAQEITQWANSLARRNKFLEDAGLEFGTTRRWDGSPESAVYITGNTFPFAAVFKQFGMKWSSFMNAKGRTVKGWILPYADWRVVETRIMAALGPVVASYDRRMTLLEQGKNPDNPVNYPWSKGPVKLINSRIEDEAESSAVVFTLIGGEKVVAKYLYLDGHTLNTHRMSNEDALKLWDTLKSQSWKEQT